MDSGDTEKQTESAPTSPHEDIEYERAMRRALCRKPFLHSDGKNLTREEIHDRDRARAEEKATREAMPVPALKL